MGTQVAHSGTVAGFLFEPGPTAEDRMEHARVLPRRAGVKRPWEFSTVFLPAGGGPVSAAISASFVDATSAPSAPPT